MKRIIPFSHELIKSHLQKGDIAIDATCGNGYDTVELCRAVGTNGFVYAFDIQQKAIDSTIGKLQENHFSNYQLIHDSHTNFKKHINNNVNLIIYNLGYLPGSDKNITTNYETTITSIQEGLDILKKNGIIILVVYSGHPSGQEESIELTNFVTELPSKEYQVFQYKTLNTAQSPYIIVIEKTK